ncbi:MAG: DoxX family protein [Flavobacteriia bacterium]|nr:DoxX family protein [Flavobacteriia bacterium]
MVNFQKQQDVGLMILRVSVSLLILLHGIGNMASGYAFIKDVLSSMGLPSFLAYGVFVGEIVAPILIIAGYRARLSAAVLAFNMLAAIFMVHAGEIFALNQFGGWAIELQGLYFLGALSILFAGPGKFAVSTNHPLD